MTDTLVESTQSAQSAIPDNFITTEFPRYAEPNPLGLSKLDLIQKRREVEELSDMYPHLPIHLIKDIWDYHHISDKTELLEKINNGFFETKTEDRLK